MPRKVDILCDKCCAMLGRQRRDDVDVGMALCRACHLKSLDEKNSKKCGEGDREANRGKEKA